MDSPTQDYDSVIEKLNEQIKMLEKQLRISQAKLESSLLNRKVIEETLNQQTILYEQVKKDLEDSRKEIVLRMNEMDAILAHIPNGVFTFNADFKISKEFSPNILKILGKDDIITDDPFELLFNKSDIGSDRVSQAKSAILSSFDTDKITFEANKANLPRHLIKNNGQTLELDWLPITDAQDCVSKILVSVTDNTEKIKSELKAKEKNLKLAILNEILNIGFSNINLFFDTTFNFLSENKLILAKNLEREDINTIFRNLHTIKGIARTYKFAQAVDVLHDTEQYFDEIKKGNRHYIPSEAFQKHEEVKSVINSYYNLYNEKIAKFFDKIILQNETINKLSTEYYYTMPEEKKAHLADSLLFSRKYKKFREILHDELNSLSDIALFLGKLTPELIIEDQGIYFLCEHANLFKNIFIHCLRNSIDHGIESEKERLLKNKKAKGIIYFQIMCSSNFVEIHMSDDGRGLNLPLLKCRGIAQKILNEYASDDEIADLIFMPSVSTADHCANEISGRGVGMDAVKKFIEEHQGSIALRFIGSVNSDGFRNFKFIISLPIQVALQVTDTKTLLYKIGV